MLRKVKLNALISSALKSLCHSQYERINKPFDKDLQYGLSANNYHVLTEFDGELDEWLSNADEGRLSIYVTDAYYKVARYALLFVAEMENYERVLVCNDGKAALDITKYDALHECKAFRRAEAFADALEHHAKFIHRESVKYLSLKLTPYNQLSLDSFNISGEYMRDPAPATSTGTATTERKSKKPAARPFANFTDKLKNGFTETDLNNLLIHVNFINSSKETLPFTKYLMHHVIDALVNAGYFEKGSQENDQKALSRYLGIKETRVTVEHGRSKKTVKNRVESYLSELKNQRKING